MRAWLPGGPPPPPLASQLTLARLHQVHGADVAVVDAEPSGRAGMERFRLTTPHDADALVATGTQWCLAVLAADCGTVALASDSGVFAAVHAGWRGLVAGVVERAVDSMRSYGSGAVVAGIGPCIGACCYEFSPRDLDTVAAVYGDGVRGRTTTGRDSMDLAAGLRVALGRAGVELVADGATCTACGPDHFSYRARGDDARHALLMWRD
jgi:polyphenol oxidase